MYRYNSFNSNIDDRDLVRVRAEVSHVASMDAQPRRATRGMWRTVRHQWQDPEASPHARMRLR